MIGSPAYVKNTRKARLELCSLKICHSYFAAAVRYYSFVLA